MVTQDDLARVFGVSFEPPPGWRCRTLVGFSAPDSEGAANPAAIVVARDELGDSETLHEQFERLASSLSSLPGFRAIRYRGFAHSGHDAFAIDYEWLNARGPLRQITALVETRVEGAGRFVTSVTTSCAAYDHAATEPVFSRIFEQLRARTSSLVAKEPAIATTPVSADDVWALGPGLIPMPGMRRAR